jgi:hypothetical protein
VFKTLLAAVLIGFHAHVASAQIVDERACESPPTFAAFEKGWAKDSSGFRQWVTRSRYQRIV